MNSEQVKNLAREMGADLVGIAPIERFKDVPMNENPVQIKPDAKSVIIMAFRILRGAQIGRAHV